MGDRFAQLLGCGGQKQSLHVKYWYSAAPGLIGILGVGFHSWEKARQIGRLPKHVQQRDHHSLLYSRK